MNTRSTMIDTDHSSISDVLQYYRERKEQLIADLKNGPYKLGFLSMRRPITGKDLQVMRASATAFEPPNPSFLVEMRRTHVVKRFVLVCPLLSLIYVLRKELMSHT